MAWRSGEQRLEWHCVLTECDKPAVCCRGHSFFSTNAELLEAYSQCETAADVIAAQNAWLEQATAGVLAEGCNWAF
jgi:hypothetical protein